MDEIEVVADDVEADDAPGAATMGKLDPSARHSEQHGDLPNDLLGPVLAAAPGGLLGRQPLVEPAATVLVAEPLLRLRAQLLGAVDGERRDVDVVELLDGLLGHVMGRYSGGVTRLATWSRRGGGRRTWQLGDRAVSRAQNRSHSAYPTVGRPAYCLGPSTERGDLVNSNDLANVRRTLWAAADSCARNSTLAPSEYRGPVLGLIFLAYAEHRFEQVRPELEAKATARRP